jgi:hypothetical protein
MDFLSQEFPAQPQQPQAAPVQAPPPMGHNNIEDALSAMPVDELFEYQRVAQEDEKKAKAYVAQVKGIVTERFAPRILALLNAQQKEHGSASETISGIKVEGECKKSVKWDSAILMQAMRMLRQTMPADKVDELFKIELSISETVFKTIAANVPPEVLKLILDARTVEVAPVAVKLTLPKPKAE